MSRRSASIYTMPGFLEDLPQDSSSRYFSAHIYECRKTKDVSMWKHYNDSIEIIYVLKGCTRVGFSDEMLFLNTDNLLVINPYLVHEGFPKKNSRRIIAHIQSDLFYRYFSKDEQVIFDDFYSSGYLLFKGIRKEPGFKKIIKDHLLPLANYQDAKDKNFVEFRAAHHMLELTLFLRQEKLSVVINNTLKKSEKNYNKTLHQINAFLIKEFRDTELSLKKIAEKFNINYYTLSRIFKHKTGYSFKEYLNILRVNMACNLLTNTEKKVTELAFLLGFSDSSYFTHVFHEFKGMSPSEFRKKFSGQKNTNFSQKNHSIYN